MISLKNFRIMILHFIRHKKDENGCREVHWHFCRRYSPVLEAQEDFSNDALFETLKGFAAEKGYKVGYVMWPLRTAVSGKQSTPGGATELMEVFGKEESLRRIRLGIEKLQ